MKTWIISDVHGYCEEFMQLLCMLHMKESDRLILLGDVVDRGPDSAQMLEWVMRNVKADGQVQMLKGNHEWFIEMEYLNQVESNEKELQDIYFPRFDFNQYKKKLGYKTVVDMFPMYDFISKLPRHMYVCM